MATPNKAQFLTEIQTLLKKRYKTSPPPSKPSIIEAVVYAICHQGTTRVQAEKTLARFKEDYFDWNELRVTSMGEIEAVFADQPDGDLRAIALRRFLKQLFSKTYSFTLDALIKKPQKEALATLVEYDAFKSDYIEATVVRLALGGHAIPVDTPMKRALTRLGVAPADVAVLDLRSLLERAVPKAKGPEFVDLVEDLAFDTCVEGTPNCPECELKSICPTAPIVLAQLAGGAKVGGGIKVVTKVPRVPKIKGSGIQTPVNKSAKGETPTPPTSGRNKGKPTPPS
ncbi:endonuclease [Isosphaeraceae bacterium EP7]